jgi:hypothetical protein
MSLGDLAIVRKVVGPFREFGWGAGALYAIDRVLSGISPRLRLHVYEWVVQPIAAEPVQRSFRRKLAIREIRGGDPEIALMPVRPEIMRERLRRQATCLGAFRDTALIGYMWFCGPSHDEDEVRCTYHVHPPERAVFDFDFYLYPEHRLGLGFVTLWNGANEYLAHRGVEYTFSRLTRFNLASRRAHRHLGCKRVGLAVFLQAWKLEFMLATVFPYLHLSLTEAGRAQIHLHPDVVEG